MQEVAHLFRLSITIPAMKNITLFLCAVLFFLTAFSQKERLQSDRYIVLKWAPGSLTAGKLTLGGEYHFKKKNALELFIGFPTGTHHGFNYDNNSSSLESKASSTLAGYRYYFSKNGGTGLYIEPYFKYLHHQASGFLQGDLNGEPASFDTHTDYKGVGGGIQFGVQFFIAKTVSIDFFFLGPEANSSTFSLTATDVSGTLPWTSADANEAEQDIKDALKFIPIVGKKVDVQVDENTRTVSTRYSGFVPGLRFGMSIGIKL